MLLKSLSVLLLFWTSLIQAQNNNTDSLIGALQSMPSDINKIFTYQTIAQQYLTQKLDSSILYAEKGLKLARVLDFFKGTIQFLNIIGNYHERKTAYDLALDYYNEALKICEQYNYTQGFAIILNNIAIIYTRTGAHEKALKLYFEALEAEEKTNNQKGIAQAYNNIGIVYYYQQNISKTLEYFEKSIVIEEDLREPDILLKGYNNIGALYSYQKKYTTALTYYKKSFVLSQQLNDKQEMSINLNNIAVAYHSLENLDSAIIYHNQSIQLREELGDDRGAAYSYHNLASVSRDRDNYKDAELFYLKSLALSQEKKLKEVELETYKSLANLWTEQKQFEKANEYLNLHISAKDSMINEQSTKAIAEAESKYQTTKKEKEILLQQNKINKQQLDLDQKNIQLLSLGSIAIIFMLTVLDDYDSIFKAIQAGANGYLLKETNASDLHNSILETINGGAAMTPVIAQKALQLLRTPNLQQTNLKQVDIKLTKREVEILEQLSHGLSSTKIAANLNRSPKTIRNHIEHIYKKLQVHSKLEAVQKAKDNFII